LNRANIHDEPDKSSHATHIGVQFSPVEITRMQRWGVVLFLYAALLGSYYFFPPDEKATALQPLLSVAGWDDIRECGSVTSLDGAKTLEFASSHKVGLTETDVQDEKEPRRTTDGSWSFDEQKKRYTITFGDKWTDYTLITPDGSSVCILARGDIGAVNLRESWFGRIEIEPDDDYAPDRD
jgi:hypothetical protein